MPSTNPPQGTPDLELFADEQSDRKREILDAAVDVFAENGYTGGSMREIAGRVGVSEPALYRHFPGKEAMFRTLVRLGAGRMRDEALALIDRVEADNVRPQLVAIFIDRRRALRRYNVLLRAVVPAAMHHEGFLGELREAMVFPVHQRLTEKAVQLDEALGRPSNATATRESRVRALIALFVGYFVSSTVLQDAPDDAMADAALKIMGWD